MLLKKKIINWTGSNHTKRVLQSNPKCVIQHTLINIHPNEYS